MTITPPFEQNPVFAGMPGIVHGFFRPSGLSRSCFARFRYVRDARHTTGNGQGQSQPGTDQSRAWQCRARDSHPDPLQQGCDGQRPVRPRLQARGRPGRQDAHQFCNRIAGPKPTRWSPPNPDWRSAFLTGDCAPLLFVEPKARVVAACHAGRRGAASGIIDKTVEGHGGGRRQTEPNPRRHRTDHFG